VRELFENIIINLNNLDDATELNGVGLSKIDKELLSRVHIHDLSLHKVCSLVVKYKKQIDDLEIVASAKQLMNTVPEVCVFLKVSSGSMYSILSGKLEKDDFQEYLAIHKKYKFRGGKFENKFAWRLDKFSDFNIDSFIADLEGIKIGCDKIELPSTDKVDYNDYSAITITKAGSIFKIKFNYHEELIELFSNKSGLLSGITEYNPVDKTRETFEISLVKEIIEKVKKNYSKFSINLSKEVKIALINSERIEEKYNSPISSVEKIIAKGFKLRPFQNKTVRLIEKAGGNFLLGLATGVGKTLCTLAWCAIKRKRVVVVCPKVVRRTWINEANKFFPNYYKTLELIPKNAKKIHNLDDYNLVSVNYESLNKFSHMFENFDVLVLDESHLIKNPKTKRFNEIESIHRNFSHVLELSGTVIKNKKEELYTQISLIAPNLFDSQTELKFMTIGGLWNKIRKHYVSMRKEDVLKDLPKEQLQIIEVDAGKINFKFKNELPSFEEVAKFKIAAAHAKVSKTVEFIKELLKNTDENIFVGSESVEVAKKIVEKLGKCSVLHHGQMSDDKREQIKHEFQNTEKYRVLVTTRQSLSVGATLTRASLCVVNDIPFNHADLSQFYSRLVRIGQTKSVNVYLMTATSKWDIKLTRLLLTKLEIMKKVTQGKQLSEKEKKVYEGFLTGLEEEYEEI